MTPSATPRRQVLLIEPHSLFRSTLASIVRQLEDLEVHATSSFQVGRVILETQRIHGLMLNIGEDLAGLDLLKALRAGHTVNPRELPTALLADSVRPDTIDLVKALAPQRLLLMPFKVRTAFEVIRSLVAQDDSPQERLILA